MDKRHLPTTVIVADKELEVFTDYRDILDIFTILSDPDLLEYERVAVALDYFYKTDDYIVDYKEAVLQMYNFITAGEPEPSAHHESKPLLDWDQDFTVIAAPISKIVGRDIRGMEYLHWWSFLSAFMEIGECTFSTYVSIRDKMNRGVKLEKHEERIYREHKDKILLHKKVDSTTQALMDEILGKG